MQWLDFVYLFFFFNDTATTEIYTLSLHDALPISGGYALTRIADVRRPERGHHQRASSGDPHELGEYGAFDQQRSEEHTSELQSRLHLVCRLLLEKKKKTSQQRRI